MKEKAIYILGDQGVDFITIQHSLMESCPNREIKIIAKEDLLTDDFHPDHVSTIILPGGGHAEYDVKLGNDGFAAIQDFVANGGCFAGFCAGAYYASQKIEWRMESPDECQEKHPSLRFFNGIARGPVKELLATNNPDDWDWKDSSSANISVSMNGEEFQMMALYWGGPHLIGDVDRFDILARYDDIKDNPPCLMTRNHGKGKIILSSIHPEVSMKQLEPFTRGDNNHPEHIKRVAKELAPFENDRKKIWNHLVSIMTEKKAQPAPAAKLSATKPRTLP